MHGCRSVLHRARDTNRVRPDCFRLIASSLGEEDEEPMHHVLSINADDFPYEKFVIENSR